MTQRTEAQHNGVKVARQLDILRLVLRQVGAVRQTTLHYNRFLKTEHWEISETRIRIEKVYGSYGELESYTVFFQGETSLMTQLTHISTLGKNAAVSERVQQYVTQGEESSWE